MEASSIVGLLRDGVDTGDVETVKRCLKGRSLTEDVMAKLLTRSVTADIFHEEIINLILEAGANPNLPGDKVSIKTKCCALHRFSFLNGGRIESSKYPLIAATQLGNVEAVKLLLHCGANVDVIDVVDGYTPLYMATYYFNSEIINILLLNGAQPNKKVINETPFTLLLKNIGNFLSEITKERENILRIMLNHGANANVMLSYADYSTIRHVPALLKVISRDVDTATVKEMVIRTADVNKTDNYRRSPLYMAVVCDRADLVKLLLDHGANPNSEYGSSGQTVLMEAIYSNVIRPARVLLEAGAYINVQDSIGRSVLQYALNSSNADALALLVLNNVRLVRKNSKVDQTQNGDQDDMMYACYVSKNEEMSWLLFLAGASLKIIQKWSKNIPDSSFSYQWQRRFIRKTVGNPQPLIQICRTVIRQRLSSRIQSEVELLPTANALKEYILIPEAKQILKLNGKLANSGS